MTPGLLLLVGLLILPGPQGADPGVFPGLLLVCGLALMIAVVAPGPPDRRIKAAKQCDPDGTPWVFTLTLGQETATLDPGRTWVQADRHKWVTRGLIEEPQSFHVQRDGTVEINGEKIQLSDPDGIVKLELEVNKRHVMAPAHPPPHPTPAGHTLASPARSTAPEKVRFKVKLDRLGHLMIESQCGAERSETGLRGLPALVQNGLMLPPGKIHLDPLQRGVEIDGRWFDSSETGARELEETLNTKYAATVAVDPERGVEVRPNPASPTGFDIHFVTVRVGARFDVKGHLSQELLDTLQNPAKCDLLKPGIVLRLSPPHIIARRKRPDGGEEHIPDIADLNYLRSNARQVQEFFNHPLMRRSGGGAEKKTVQATELRAGEILDLQGRPFTTPPIAASPPAAGSVVLPGTDLAQDQNPDRPTGVQPDRTAACPPPPRDEPFPPPDRPSSSDEAETQSAAPACLPEQRPLDNAPFTPTDLLRVDADILRHLADRFGVGIQDIRLSLPRVFADRRFQIIRFSDQEIESVLDLRSEGFYGFYLSHIADERIDLVYACRGTHIEWGADKCVLQPSPSAEPVEFKGGALLGLAQTGDNQFVFLVTPAYREWVRPYESRCREAFAHFLSVDQIATWPEPLTFLWPAPRGGTSQPIAG